MDYIEVKVTPQPYSETAADVLAAVLAPLGFDSFVNDGARLVAYCPQDQYDETALRECLDRLPMPDVSCTYEAERIETQDWNAEWESEAFVPIQIDDRCIIHAPSQSDVPTCPYDIVIAPKMSFGSGHHETTSQILAELLDLPLVGRRVLDMGCGTAVLGILAARCGAATVLAIDIDDWVCRNAEENVALNRVPQVRVACGDARLLDGESCYDVVLANINRNILLADMARYVAHLAPGGLLLMSGFYEEDIPAIRTCAEGLGLNYQYHRSRNRWVVIRFAKLEARS